MIEPLKEDNTLEKEKSKSIYEPKTHSKQTKSTHFDDHNAAKIVEINNSWQLSEDADQEMAHENYGNKTIQ